jgi:hypothetical protein
MDSSLGPRGEHGSGPQGEQTGRPRAIFLSPVSGTCVANTSASIQPFRPRPVCRSVGSGQASGSSLDCRSVPPMEHSLAGFKPAPGHSCATKLTRRWWRLTENRCLRRGYSTARVLTTPQRVRHRTSGPGTAQLSECPTSKGCRPLVQRPWPNRRPLARVYRYGEEMRRGSGHCPSGRNGQSVAGRVGLAASKHAQARRLSSGRCG